MIAFCTHCWSEIDADLEQCPHCATDLRKDHRSYEEKLIAALAHPLPGARARICWLIGRNGIRTAVPRLMQMVKRDQDSFVRRAAVEALGSLRDPCAIALLHAISGGTDRFLASAAKNSLTRIGSPRDAG
jgi:HEAT repeat protein